MSERDLGMHVDGITLLAAGCFVAGLGGLLLLAAWAEMRRAPALLWWGSGHLVNGAAASFLSIGLATRTIPTVIVGAGGIVASMALYYGGVRVFTERRPSPWVLAAAAAIWALSVPSVAGTARISVGVSFLVTAALLFIAVAELWVAGKERLVGRWALIGVFALHAAFMAVGGIGLIAGGIAIEPVPPLLSWFGLIHFERLFFLIAGAVFMVLLVRERHERISATAADVDALTGIVNRGAFFSRAERIRGRAAIDGTPVALIAFDLDHFKRINDTYGHPVGDRVLKAFTDSATSVLRPGDLFGRIGGEEFAAILPGAGIDAACIVAERIRRAFERTPKTIANGMVEATVSAGVAGVTGEMSLENLFEAADNALYRAKALGRNRVERDAAIPRQTHSKVMQVA